MIIMDYYGLWTIPRPLEAKAVTTAQRYGAGLAHTTPFLGHGLSCIMDYRGLSWIMDSHGLPQIVDFRGLSRVIMDYGSS
jgi:hypothetical protein